MTSISIRTLKEHSPRYVDAHGINQADADLASELASIIRATRVAGKPTSGDIMICIGPERTYYDGHIAEDNLEDFSSICTKPYIAFVTKMQHTEEPQVSFDTSGGYWLSIPKPCHSKVRYVGTRYKLFKAWGHCGACADGAFNFLVKVNVWEYESSVIY